MRGVVLPLLALLFLAAPPARADFQVPALTGPVVDQAGMLSSGARQRLEAFLRRLHDGGGSQIQVAIVSDLGGVSIEEASIKTVDKWKLGHAKTDDGVLLMIAAKEHRVRIEVGQGREGDLPDLIASRIIREVIVPGMRQGDPDRAVLAGVAAIVHYTDPGFLEQQQTVSADSPPGRDGSRLLLILKIIFLLLILTPLFLGRFFGGFWGGGGFGGFGGGGFGGGGFGGGGGWSGGGGGFSGGGASGGW
jgi:uncharacterized protein